MQPATREFQPGTGKVIHLWNLMDRIVGEISGYTMIYCTRVILPQVNSHSYVFLLQSISHGAWSQMPADDEDETWPDGSAASVIDMAPGLRQAMLIWSPMTQMFQGLKLPTSHHLGGLAVLKYMD